MTVKAGAPCPDCGGPMLDDIEGDTIRVVCPACPWALTLTRKGP